MIIGGAGSSLHEVAESGLSVHCEALSTVAALVGGPALSSGEASVMGVERMGRVICGLFARATGRDLLGGDAWASQV
jgi:hypothetical protein